MVKIHLFSIRRHLISRHGRAKRPSNRRLHPNRFIQVQLSEDQLFLCFSLIVYILEHLRVLTQLTILPKQVLALSFVQSSRFHPDFNLVRGLLPIHFAQNVLLVRLFRRVL